VKTSLEPLHAFIFVEEFADRKVDHGASLHRSAVKGNMSQKVLQASGLAVLFADWTLSGTARDGYAIEMSGQTSDVLLDNLTGVGGW
jgi:hypothetical protein